MLSIFTITQDKMMETPCYRNIHSLCIVEAKVPHYSGNTPGEHYRLYLAITIYTSVHFMLDIDITRS